MPRVGPVVCPSCGSARVKPDPPRGLGETLSTWIGYDAARCLECSLHFVAKPGGGVSGARFAKCPKCLRLDLTTWDPKFYRPSLMTRMKLEMGANRWRCEPCRTNFASFRPRKEKYARPAGTGAAASGEKV